MVRKPHYSKEEFSRRGMELYEQQIRSKVEAGNKDKIVAIDIDTGAFSVAENSLLASEHLISTNPHAQIWCVRIGQGPVHRFGAKLIKDKAWGFWKNTKCKFR